VRLHHAHPASRLEARQAVMAAANAHIRTTRHTEPLNARQIQQAVQLVRHHALVSPAVLEAAGFKVSARPIPRRTLVLTAKQRRETAAGAAVEVELERPACRVWLRPWRKTKVPKP
jgi:hypothetical protein